MKNLIAELLLKLAQKEEESGNDSNLLIVFYVQIMPDDFVMQLHRFTCTLRFLRAVRVQTGCANNAWWDRL